MINYYEVLGVNIKAESIVIRSAYKAMVQKYHPDKAVGQKQIDEYLEKTKLINEAYNALSDEVKRNKYDEELSKNNNSEKNHSNEGFKKDSDSSNKKQSNQSSDKDLNKEPTNNQKKRKNKFFQHSVPSFLIKPYLIIILSIISYIGFNYYSHNYVYKENVISSEPNICYLYYDGKRFVKGKVAISDYKTFSIDHYGIKAIEWAIPNKMYEYLNENTEIDIHKGEDKLSKFFRDNFSYSKSLCGFDN
jgi:cation transport ATPase